MATHGGKPTSKQPKTAFIPPKRRGQRRAVHKPASQPAARNVAQRQAKPGSVKPVFAKLIAAKPNPSKRASAGAKPPSANPVKPTPSAQAPPPVHTDASETPCLVASGAVSPASIAVAQLDLEGTSIQAADETPSRGSLADMAGLPTPAPMPSLTEERTPTPHGLVEIPKSAKPPTPTNVLEIGIDHNQPSDSCVPSDMLGTVIVPDQYRSCGSGPSLCAFEPANIPLSHYHTATARPAESSRSACEPHAPQTGLEPAPAATPTPNRLTQAAEASDLLRTTPTPSAHQMYESPADSPAASLHPDWTRPPVPEPEPVMPAMEMLPADGLPPLLFEIGWEVCWQLGGIYTVLRTKAAAMIARWGDRYCLIGPYNPNTAPVEFEPMEAPGPLGQALQRLAQAGIPCYYGRWLIPSRPHTILIDYRALYRQTDSDKYLMWADHGISLASSDFEINDVVAFGFAVTEFFRHLCQTVTDRAILAHFHEWMGSVAVLRIAHLQLPVGTVFTTHATLLGRYLGSDDPQFYHHLDGIDPDAEARRYQIYPRHQIERAAAQAATVFTTVSEVTAREARKILGRAPDAILPNGINIQRFAALHEFQNLHLLYKEKINQFVMGHFFPCYTFDLDNTIYLFTSGRYEYRNKGMDLFIEALWRLNRWLLGVPADQRPTVVAFLVTRASVRNINVSVIQNQMMFRDLENTCHEVQEEMGRRLLWTAAHGRLPTAAELISDDAQVRLKRAMHAWRSGRTPVIVTHDLVDDTHDPILQHLRHRGLFNAAADPVKVVFHPQFISPTSPMLGMEYEQFIRGCHMGIFPSCYEPWGYTPMECAAMGLPSVTTDLSGFGAYVQRELADDHEGIYVLNRSTQSFEQSADDLTRYLFEFLRLNRRERIAQRNKVENTSARFDWNVLARHYHLAHDLAFQNLRSRRAIARQHAIV